MGTMTMEAWWCEVEAAVVAAVADDWLALACDVEGRAVPVLPLLLPPLPCLLAAASLSACACDGEMS